MIHNVVQFGNILCMSFESFGELHFSTDIWRRGGWALYRDSKSNTSRLFGYLAMMRVQLFVVFNYVLLPLTLRSLNTICLVACAQNACLILSLFHLITPTYVPFKKFQMHKNYSNTTQKWRWRRAASGQCPFRLSVAGRVFGADEICRETGYKLRRADVRIPITRCSAYE